MWDTGRGFDLKPDRMDGKGHDHRIAVLTLVIWIIGYAVR
jgi:hypothetical protein